MTMDVIRALVEVVFSFLVGLLALVGGSGLLAYEVVHPPTHTAHVFLFAGIALLGALILAKQAVIGAAKSMLDVAGPYLPYGRRAYDNPKPPPDAP